MKILKVMLRDISYVIGWILIWLIIEEILVKMGLDKVGAALWPTILVAILGILSIIGFAFHSWMESAKRRIKP